MFNVEALLAMRKLVNEQLRRKDCECLGENDLELLRCKLTDAINAAWLCKLIKHIEDAMPDDDLDAAAFDKAIDAFYAKKFTVGFDGMSITLPVGPEIYDGMLTALHDYYDAYYIDYGTRPSYELRQKLHNLKRNIDFIESTRDRDDFSELLDRYDVLTGNLNAIIDDLLKLF